ncbi:MAG TPA: hypothetical protein VGK19_20305 [Capsulimonadaceae bacterium]
MIRVVARSGSQWQTLAKGYHSRVYDLQAGDIEGRGLDDIVVGLIQRTKLSTAIDRRIHVYAVDKGRGFRPRWRGSSLSYPFDSFIVATPLPGRGNRAVLIAAERNPLPEYSGFAVVTVYRWSGFGFTVDWQTPVRGQVRDIRPSKTGPQLFDFTQINGDVSRKLYVYSDPWHVETQAALPPRPIAREAL